MALPVKPVVRPANIANVNADQINRADPKQLVPRHFPGVGIQLLHPQAARCYDVMAFEFNRPVKDGGTGLILSCAGQGSGHRSYRTQVSAFQLRMTATWVLIVNGLFNRLNNTRTWNGTPGNRGIGKFVRYFLRKGMIPIAIPGGGWHPLGLALDVALYDPVTRTVRAIRSNKAAFNWLITNAGSFGWSWENSRLGADDPHLHYFAGDAIPQRVRQVEAFFKAASK